ncbi:MAG: hypothetical protein HZA50_15680 [Planctomycetes bacterium]|nr:hypothetical protein [Planctomycetota bacterium]
MAEPGNNIEINDKVAKPRRTAKVILIYCVISAVALWLLSVLLWLLPYKASNCNVDWLRRIGFAWLKSSEIIICDFGKIFGHSDDGLSPAEKNIGAICVFATLGLPFLIACYFKRSPFIYGLMITLGCVLISIYLFLVVVSYRLYDFRIF